MVGVTNGNIYGQGEDFGEAKRGVMKYIMIFQMQK